MVFCCISLVLCFSELTVLFEVTDKDSTNTGGWGSWQKLKIPAAAPLFWWLWTRSFSVLVSPSSCACLILNSMVSFFSAWEADATYQARDNTLTFHTLTHWCLKTLPIPATTTSLPLCGSSCTVHVQIWWDMLFCHNLAVTVSSGLINDKVLFLDMLEDKKLSWLNTNVIV